MVRNGRMPLQPQACPPAHLCVWPCLAGWVVDKRGGYKDETGHSTVIALECCVLFGVCALVCSILTVLFRDFLAVIAALWLVLFFGGYGLCAVRGCRLHHLTPATPVWTQPQMPAPSRDGDHHRGCAAPPSIVQFCMGHDAVQLSRLRRCALHLRPACAGTPLWRARLRTYPHSPCVCPVDVTCMGLPLCHGCKWPGDGVHGHWLAHRSTRV